MTQSVGYIRKSVLRKGSRTISPQVQEEEVRRLAERYGDTDVLILGDIGKSGRKAENRPDYQRLLSMIEAGQVKAVYAYSMSRLCRSVKDYAALSELCVARRVPVRLYKEGEQDYSTATGRLVAGVLSNIAAFVAELASEQAKETIAAKVANGEHHGERPYGHRDGESMDSVIAAFRAAGSFHGAARLLNGNGTPTRRGRPWRATTVRVLLNSHAPEVVPPGQVQRAKSAPRFRLARLLSCPCGRTLTGVMQKGHARYVCVTAFDGNDHPWKKSVSESLLMPWMMTEAARLRVPTVVELEADDAERGVLDDRLERLSRQHELGLLSDGQLAERAAEVQAARERLDIARSIINVPDRIEWGQWTPEAINAALRALWSRVDLDSDLRPVAADWRVPEWRDAA